MTRDMISHLRHEPVNLREHTSRLQQGGEIGFEKKDFMALTGIFIADAWKPMYEWIEEHNRALPEIVRHGELAGTFVENRPDDFANEKFPETIIESIRGQIKDFYKFYLDRWYKEQERLLAEYKRGVLPIEQEEKIKKYNALRDFVSNGGKNENVEQHISSGLGTATNVILNVFKVIPLVYRNTFRPKTISSGELADIIRDSRKLVLVLASIGISGFVQLEEELGLIGDRDSYDFTKFDLVTKTEGGKFSLEIEPTVLERVKRRVREKQETTGCPALAINGPSGKNIISEFYDWLTAIAEQQYYPFFDRLGEKLKKI